MTALAEQRTSIALSGEDLDRLLVALAGHEPGPAASVAEQIAALRLAGGPIDLFPTEAELAALRLAFEALGLGEPLPRD